MKKNYPPKGTFYMYPQYDDNNDLVGFTTDYEGAGAYGKRCKITSTGETLIRCNGGDLEVKEVNLEEELDEWMKYGPHTNYPWCTIPDAIKITAEHFFELGIKMAQKKE